ncbi:hypothetical protein KsCSTR_27480 [Candidatus Kuenenia stuttgartiensis]|jgi:hypothetical protein|uniref:Uncharacterized protein n=1 Tax=Kuenenia stuttgartiensis TaxID=174633 RepID=Q1Q0M1_KUEST|nr:MULTISPECIES: hypothetical protein [Kuenenia]MBE7549137.1 hypothetical protein [Planctomycetia bacterium]MBZ0190670.1 hypothetical protein [Candidatus Kuenenia stuttgartiensis]MCF6152560.1 hypothetical protein [Candidatus Kuenenia stuttgartiensis]MCL4727435.1 hypothetical protein [Candidatus Kuenenia stuttgartiensis]MCZ7621979.1 hypothetical protein [Candidatus Kuenenia sp.]
MNKKNTSASGRQPKKSTSGKKSSTKKNGISSDTSPESKLLKSPLFDKTSAVTISNATDSLLALIEKNPLKRIDTNAKENVVKSYEKLIRKLVKEINSTRS